MATVCSPWQWQHGRFAAGPEAALQSPRMSRIAGGKEMGDGTRRGYGWDRGNCRDVTVRERRDGEVIVRHIRRCD